MIAGRAPRLRLRLVDERLAVVRLDPAAPLPDWATGRLWSATRTARELSLVCHDEGLPPDVQAERGWRCLEVAGPLAFEATGILAAIAAPLAEAGISLFALSTYDTDYLLIKEERLAETCRVLEAAGHRIG